eukprot:361050-Chlamydomonas_euryale.AAC.1
MALQCRDPLAHDLVRAKCGGRSVKVGARQGSAGCRGAPVPRPTGPRPGARKVWREECEGGRETRERGMPWRSSAETHWHMTWCVQSVEACRWYVCGGVGDCRAREHNKVLIVCSAGFRMHKSECFPTT